MRDETSCWHGAGSGDDRCGRGACGRRNERVRRQRTDRAADVQLLSAWPVGPERFKSIIWNGSATDQQVTTFAICGNKPAGYAIIASQPGTDTGGPDTIAAGAQCPAGTSVVGGGVQITSPRPAVTIGASFQDSGPQWLSETVNNGAPPATETTYAICAA